MQPNPEEAQTVAEGAPAPARILAAHGTSRLFWLGALGIVTLDQITKTLVLDYIPLFGTVTVIPGMLDLVHIQNAGVAFGLLNDSTHPWRSTLTTALALTALGGIAYYTRHIKPEERFARIGLALILGGAIGNIVDRFNYGHVIDFIDFYIGDWHFWAFNVADASISIGACLVFLELIFLNRHASHSV